MSSRSEVVQTFLDLQESPSYLEIGVNEGETFHKLNARRKVAVDPQFLFPARNSIADGKLVEYHEVPSDVYFGQIASHLDRFDVVYLDGLHVMEQTLRDMLNAVPLLKPHGIIVVDDVKPSNYAASLPSMHDFTIVRHEMSKVNPGLPVDGSWMGDVFKLVFFIDSFMQQFSFATVAENHGQTVIWRQPRAKVTERSLEQIGRMEYKDFLQHKADMNTRPLQHIVAQIRASRLAA